MNIDTGEIKIFKYQEEFLKAIKEKCIPIKKEYMTKKQKKEMAVSLHDSKSKLGKKLVKERRKRKKRMKKRMKNMNI